jgi:Tol biopolymer transport system component
MKDEADLVQLYRVPTTGGNIIPLTYIAYTIQGQCNVSPDGRWISFLADNSVWLTDAVGGTPRRLTPRTNDAQAPLGGALWNHLGNRLVYNRYDINGFLQIYSIPAF